MVPKGSKNTNRIYEYLLHSLPTKTWEWREVVLSDRQFKEIKFWTLIYLNTDEHIIPQPKEYEATNLYKFGIAVSRVTTGNFKSKGFEVAPKTAQVLYGKP